MTNLEKSKMYVLGPLEISPYQFAVGERSYIAIKGNMPKYNAMRQKLYLQNKKDIADAIGELEARALAAEKFYEESISARKSAESKYREIALEFAEYRRVYAPAIKKYAKETKRPLIKVNAPSEEEIRRKGKVGTYNLESSELPTENDE